MVNDPVAFARWHLGEIEWGAALRSDAIEIIGPRTLARALPTWSNSPEKHRPPQGLHDDNEQAAVAIRWHR